jgi:hypothetical protein
MKKKQRHRVDRERVKSNASEAGGGGLPWLRLPKGVSDWHPEKAGSYKIDILPYEVKAAHHPDRVDPGTLWYKRPFAIHHSVGVNNESVFCPVSVGKRCPMCEERARLAKNWDENEVTVRSLTPQKWVAYNIINPEDRDEILVFLFSRGKFAEFLESELLEGDEADLNFYDVTSDGRTLKVRFTEDSYEGRKFLKASRIDFVPRDAMDEDETLSKVACLDEIFLVHDYDTLNRLFSGHEDEGQASSGDDEEESEEGDEPMPKPVSKPKSKKAEVDEDDDDLEEEEEVEEEDDEDDEEDEEEEEEEAPPPKKSKKPIKSSSKTSSKSSKPKAKKPTEEEEDDDKDLDFEDDDEEDDED